MKRNRLQLVIEFVFKYIWVFCALLIFLELLSTGYTGTILMKESADRVMGSVSAEISSRVSNVVNLLESLAHDSRIKDTDADLYERAILTEPYRKNYDLYMIALCDEKVNVISSDTLERPTTSDSLAYRDYMQRLYKTGKLQITDAFLAGADGKTLNYTIAVPIKKNNEVKGCVFGSIYYNELQEILTRSISGNSSFYVLNSQTKVMSSTRTGIDNKTYLQIVKDNHLFGTNAKAVNTNIQKGTPGNYWKWNNSGLHYIQHKQLQPTSWTLVYDMNYVTVLQSLLPIWFIKSAIYIILCGVLVIIGKKYFNKRLAEVNHLLDRMSAMQKEVFLSQQNDYDELLNLTSQGLYDNLTNLHTRGVFLKKLNTMNNTKHTKCALFFIDLDDLKLLNDTYGHQAGDKALIHIANVLNNYIKQYDGIACRYGGDEFILVIDNIDAIEAQNIAVSMCKELHVDIIEKNHPIHIQGSIGISMFPEHGNHIEELICKADLALYIAKQNGKNQSMIYSDVEGGNPVL